MNDHLLIIDPQVDFHPGGSLAIPTASADALRIYSLLLRSCSSASNPASLSRVTVTLDTHHPYDIGHPSFWSVLNPDDPSQPPHPPPPFTTITAEDLAFGVVKPTDLSLEEYCLSYCRALEAGGRQRLTVWPEHCLLGTSGHNVVPDVAAGLRVWVDKQHSEALRRPSAPIARAVAYVLKGTDPLAEMYSCMASEVPSPSGAGAFDVPLLRSLSSSLGGRSGTGRLLVCGQASSHCVAASVRDILSRWGDVAEEGVGVERIVILKDCMSAVPGFEDEASKFFEECKERRVTVCDSTELYNDII